MPMTIEDGKDYMLTTVDNPYDPFTQFDQWMQFDVQKGYNTSGLIARIAATSNELSDLDNEQEIERAMLEIVKYNVYGVHKLVSRSK